MSASTIPPVKAKLFALFKAAVEAPTEVWAARTNEEHSLAENVYIGEARGTRRYVTLPARSPGSREEAYEVAVDVEVYEQGTDIEGIEARMWVIAGQLEETIAADPGLGGMPGVSWSIGTHFQQDTKATADGVLAAYSFGVAVVARI